MIYNELMNSGKMAWWLTVMSILILALSMWEVMAGFILAASTVLALGFWSNSQRDVSKGKKAVVYVLLGLVLALLDTAAVYDVVIMGFKDAFLQIGMLVLSVALLIVPMVGERKSSKQS